ncbi:MAG: hypothetical protein K6E31_09120 [bacterium]|nr:hypothetical protein [Deltaproteobacteria bacterium]MCR5221132.1 hypothetical protein [bacterium]
MIIDLGHPLTQQPLIAEAVFLQAPFLRAVLWTVLIETPLFFLFGYRLPREWLAFAGINVVSNLLLNETLSELWFYDHALLVPGIVLGEMLVVLLEFALCRSVVCGSGRRLFLVLLATNSASLLCGLCFSPPAFP